MDHERLIAGLCALTRRFGAPAEADVAGAIREALPGLLACDPVDEEGSLGRADLYRIRAAKLVARLLPPGALADPMRRGALRIAVRGLVEELVGGSLPPSVYLDRGRSR